MFIRDREGRQCVTVCLEDVALKLEEMSEHWTQYMNVATGEFAALPGGLYTEPDEELVERIEGSGDYLRLPDQRDIHEYRIMAVRGGCARQAQAGAFRFLAFIEIAKEWCEEYDIPYTTRENKKGGS